MMILRFLKHNVGDFFNKWKNFALVKVDSKFNKVTGEYNETVDEQTTLIENVKD